MMAIFILPLARYSSPNKKQVKSIHLFSTAYHKEGKNVFFLLCQQSEQYFIINLILTNWWLITTEVIK